MLPAVARVAVHRPLREPLDYALPDAVAPHARLGMRVLVPLQRQRVIGVIVDFAESSPYKNLRAIGQLIDDAPVFDEQMLGLTRWMAEYYCCGWGEALACAAPPGDKRRPTVRFQVKESLPAPIETVIRDLAGAPRQAAVLRYLAERGPASARSIQEATGGSAPHQVLRRLLDAGCIESTFAGGGLTTARRTVLAVEPACAPEQLTAEAANLAARAPRQAAVLQALSERAGPWPATELMALTSAPHATLRALESKALVRMVKVEQRRGPGMADTIFRGATDVTLTDEQDTALDAVCAHVESGEFAACVLEGVTGSGKTEVYLRAAERALALDRDVIILVPEISLTAQTVARVQARFGDDVAVLHSRLSAGERADQWRALHAGDLRIAIGPRSAVFAPVRRLGLIVVDEEHDGAYKQQDTPRYHARDVAIVRAHMAGAVALLGSATPSLESAANVAAGKYTGLTLTHRATGAPLPPVEVVDLRESLRGQRDRTCCDTMLNALGDTLQRGEQAIVFLNRRGFAPTLLCPQCGLAQSCTHCSVSMIWHRGAGVIRCHYCNAERPTPTACAYCSGDALVPLGAGTQKVEDELRAHFPAARIARMDADTTSRKGAHDEILGRVARGDVDILIGTQMIAKGLDFPNVTLVGVVNVDTSLNLPDFRAAERTAQMLMQVAGRSGRGPRGGRVIFQTYRPEHYAVHAAARHDYTAFVERELEFRRELGYPPWRHLGRVLCEGERLDAVVQTAQRVAAVVRKAPVELLGPAPAPLSRVKNKYRWHCQVLAERTGALRHAMNAAAAAVKPPAGVRLAIDMDAHNLL